MSNCILCGDEVLEGDVCGGHKFKKMCINCEFSVKNEDGTYTCNNEDNLKATKEKMIEAAKAISSSYEIKDFEIAPLPLKKPLLKCKSWNLSPYVWEVLMNSFE